METRQITTLAELRTLAEDTLSSLAAKGTGHVVGLTGDLGAGKTALVKEVAAILGIKEEITSPTFVIMKSYPVPEHARFKTLTHVDAYRIESHEEMNVLKFQDILEDSERLVCIEWPERIAGLLPTDTVTVAIEITEGETRRVTYGRN